VRITPGVGSASPVGAGVFRFATPQGLVVTESGIPSAVPTTHARLFVDKTAGHDTGIAVAVPGAQSADVHVEAFQTDGVTAGGPVGASFTLKPNGHRANVASDLLPGLPANFIGVLDVSSSAPIVALTLRSLFNQRGELLFSTIPVADMTRPAPSPVIFPHLADGGGFQTQLILLSPITPAATIVKLFGETGAPLGIAKLP
jgi:hypothetical protein